MPHVEIPQAEFKVVVLGDSHIGKTSLVTRFAEGYYRENSRPATVGAFFVTKRIQSSDNIPTKIQIWDTAGAESFRAMAPMFYKDAAAVIVCYDVARRKSFEGMRKWLDEVRQKVQVGEEVVVAIAALKADLLQEQQPQNNNDDDAVPEYEVEQLAEALGCIYLPTSAKTDRNVHALFQMVADRVLQNRQNGDGLGGSSHGSNNKDVRVNRDDLSHANGIHSSTAMIDDRIKMTSPRKRDQFDKYYVSNESNENSDVQASEKGHQLSTNEGNHDMSIPPEKVNRGSSGGNKKGKKQPSSTTRSSTPSTTDDCTTATEEGTHPLLAKTNSPKKKKDRGGGKNSMNDTDGLCADEQYYACHPSVACGATGDGSAMGCIVQ